MSKSGPIASYFMRIIELMDKLRPNREPIDDKELIITTLNGLPTSSESFIQTISGRTKLPKFDRLWVDCTHEETRIVARQRLHGTQPQKNQEFMAHAKKGKEKKRKFQIKGTKKGDQFLLQIKRRRRIRRRRRISRI